MTMSRRAAAVVVGLSVLLGAAACSDDADTLDRAATQRAVGRKVAAKVEPNVRKTTCPVELPMAEGSSFECTIELASAAGTLRVEVTQTDDRGSLEVVPLAALISDAQITAQLEELLGKQFGRPFAVDCGEKGFRVRPPESTSSCTAADLTSERKVAVTVVDAAGTLAFEVEPAE